MSVCVENVPNESLSAVETSRSVVMRSKLLRAANPHGLKCVLVVEVETNLLLPKVG